METKTIEELAVLANTEQFNKLKLLEEIHECGELVVKSMTKPPEQQDKEHLVEELGDLIIRAKILAHMIGKDLVENRIKQKEEMLCEHYKNKIERSNP